MAVPLPTDSDDLLVMHSSIVYLHIDYSKHYIHVGPADEEVIWKLEIMNTTS